MNEKEKQAYIQGGRMAWSTILRECLRNLGYDDPEAIEASWVIEREATIAALRSVCGDFGDNDWEETLILADVIEKHLARHLHAGAPNKTTVAEGTV